MKKHLFSIVLLLAVISVALAFRSNFQRFTIPQNGMYPTLPAGSTHWVTMSRTTSGRDMSVGDIVLFKALHANKTYTFVWRVVAMPGDRVVIESDKIQINGTQINRKLVRKENQLEIFAEDLGEKSFEVAYDSAAAEDSRIGCDLIVPDGHVFVLGDNRYNALDSRYLGAIPINDVFGKLNP